MNERVPDGQPQGWPDIEGEGRSGPIPSPSWRPFSDPGRLVEILCRLCVRLLASFRDHSGRVNDVLFASPVVLEGLVRAAGAEGMADEPRIDDEQTQHDPPPLQWAHREQFLHVRHKADPVQVAKDRPPSQQFARPSSFGGPPGVTGLRPSSQGGE